MNAVAADARVGDNGHADRHDEQSEYDRDKGRILRHIRHTKQGNQRAHERGEAHDNAIGKGDANIGDAHSEHDPPDPPEESEQHAGEYGP